MVSSAFKLLLVHPDSVSSFVWSRYSFFFFNLYVYFVELFSESRYSWIPSRSANIHDSQVFKTKIPDSYMFCKTSMIHDNNNNNNNIFISYIKYTNITPPANSKANRGRWCVDGLRFITNSWSEKVQIFTELQKLRPHCTHTCASGLGFMIHDSDSTPEYY